MEAIDMKSAERLVVHAILDRLIHGVIDPLDHTGEDETGFDPVLVRVDTDHRFTGTPIGVIAILLDGIEGAQSGVSSGGKENVRTFIDLSASEFLAFDGIGPGRFGDADVVRNDANCG